ncbi:MAG: hypothetical protein S4CHLAM6_05970 [Chlamydiae bacterium]|nr:hypothetical protein [Chlamydiota bacterium]
MAQFTPMQYLIALISGLIWGTICLLVAKIKGRDPRGWFFLGLLFSFFALIALLFIPSQKAMLLAAEAKAIKEKEEAEQLELQEAPTNPKATTLEKRSWYYLDKANSQVGPIDLDSLKKEKSEGNIHTKTYLWSEGMMDWKILDELNYLKTELE